MRNAVRALAGLAAGAALTAVLAAGCSSEQLSLALEVTASPNPVAGTEAEGGRRWDFQIAIANPLPVGVRVEYFHVETTATDTGYSSPLVLVEESGVVGQRVEPGASLVYPASRESNGNFSSGRERRLYHALGDDGTYYSGEVVIELQ